MLVRSFTAPFDDLGEIYNLLQYLHLHAPHLLEKTGVYVVQPNSLQRSLRNVHKVGKGQLQQRFRIYKQMWPDGGKVFAFFTVPTPTAMWTTERARGT